MANNKQENKNTSTSLKGLFADAFKNFFSGQKNTTGKTANEVRVENEKNYTTNMQQAPTSATYSTNVAKNTGQVPINVKVAKTIDSLITPEKKQSTQERLTNINKQIANTSQYDTESLAQLNDIKNAYEQTLKKAQQSSLKTGAEIYKTDEAKQKLKELNQLKETNSFSAVEDDNVRESMQRNYDSQISKLEERIKKAEERDNTVNQIGRFVDSNGNLASDEQQQSLVQTYENLNSIYQSQEALNNSYKNGEIDDSTYGVMSMTNSNKYNEEYQKILGYEYKTGYELYDAIKDGDSQLAVEMTNLLSHDDDSTLIRLANMFNASVNDLVEIPVKAMAVSYSVLTGEKESNALTQANYNNEFNDELRYYALSGASGFQKMSVQVVGSLMPQMIASTVAVATGGASGVVTGILGVQAGVNDAVEMLNKDYEPGEALTHGAMVGTISYLVEKIGADGFVDLFTGNEGQWLLDSVLHQKLLNYKEVAKTLGKQALSEGLEEIIEGVSNDGANLLFNAITASNESAETFGYDGKTFNIDTSFGAWKQLMQEGAYAGLGALLMGANSAVQVQINTYQDYKFAVGMLKQTDKVINEGVTSEKIVNVRNALASTIEGYENNSVLMDSVKKLTPDVDTTISTEEALNTGAEAHRYNIQQATEQELINKIRENGIRSALDSRGIKASSNSEKDIVDMYVNSDANVRTQMMQTARYADELGINVAFDNGNIGNGYFDKKTNEIVINTNSKIPQTSTLAHEITHTMEGTEAYNNLLNIIGDKAVNILSPETEQRYRELYNGDENAVNSEKIARYIEENLGKTEFIKSLIKYNSNTAYRLFNDIKAMIDSDEKTQLLNEWSKAFKEIEVENKENSIRYSFVEESPYDELEYELSPDIKNQLPKLVVDEIQNNLAFNNSKGLGTTEWNGYVFVVYAKTNGEFKILDYNKIDDRKTVGTLANNARRTIGANSLAEVGSFGDGQQPGQSDITGRMVNGEQRSGLSVDGLGERNFANKTENSDGTKIRNKPITNKEYKEMVDKYRQNNQKLKWSLEDSNGNELTEQQAEYFKDSKVRDENGNLQVIYHGSTSEPFYVFDREKGNPEGDWGRGFYATTSEDDVYRNYKCGGPDYEGKVERQVDNVMWNWDQYGYDEEPNRDDVEDSIRKQLGQSDYLITAYGNMTNPAIVGKTYVFADEDTDLQLDDYNSEDEYWDAVYKERGDTIEDVIDDIRRVYDISNVEQDLREVFYNAMFEDGIEIQKLKNEINRKVFDGATDEEGRLIANEITRMVLESLGYDGIIDSTVSEKFKVMILNPDTTHYIFFNSNQMKNTDNENPTINPDIRYSLEEESNPQYDDFSDAINLDDYIVNNSNRFTEDDSPQNDEPKANERIAQILTEKPELDTKKDGGKKLFKWLQDKIGDKGWVIHDISVNTGNKQLEAIYDWALNHTNMANNTLLTNRRSLKDGSIIGESLANIVDSMNSLQDRKLLFEEYMYNLLNIDRMTLSERYPNTDIPGMEPMANKPVFGESVTAETSKKITEELERLNPDFKELSQRIYDYINEDLKLAVEYGVTSQSKADSLREKYPHYVPILRNVQQVNRNGDGDYKSSNQIIKNAKGSNIDMLSLEDAMQWYTRNAYSSATTNKLYNELSETISDNYKQAVEVGDTELLEEMIGNTLVAPNGDEPAKIIYYSNGKRYMQTISDRLYEALSPRNDAIKNILGEGLSGKLQTINTLRRNVITSWNPMFTLTNGIKDIQDAIINTKNGIKFTSAYTKAIDQIKTKGDYYNLYIANGGLYNNFSSVEGNKVKGDNAVAKGVNALSNLNEAIEMAPRLAEFIASLENGKTIEQAMFDASEITVNFKRGGDVSKTLDRHGATFLNASIQGTLKQYHIFQEAKQQGTLLKYMAKLSIISSIPLIALNGLIWRDDKDYEELSEYIKKNYYIIGKVKGTFIRIPKGRVMAFYQNILKNGYDTVKGQTELWDAFIDDIVSFKDNVAPNNVVDNNIIAPIIQAINNKTWYGEDLVPTRLQNLPKSEQYDETTDYMSVWFGKLSRGLSNATGIKQFELSPYKINYLVDQYSGGVGDIVLPYFTPQSTSSNSAFAPIMNKFTTDSVMKNQNVTNFYSLKDNMQTEANRTGASDETVLANKYLSSVSSTISELYKEIREIQNNTSLDKDTKYQKVREVKQQINELCSTAISSYEEQDIVGDSAIVGGVAYSKGEDGWKKVNSTSIAYRYYDLMTKNGKTGANALATAENISKYETRHTSEGKAYENSKALQVRKSLEEQGIYDAIIEDIKQGNSTPTNWGLSKTVVSYNQSAFEKEYDNMMSSTSLEYSKAEKEEDTLYVGTNDGTSTKKISSGTTSKSSSSNKIKKVTFKNTATKTTSSSTTTKTSKPTYLSSFKQVMGRSSTSNGEGAKVCGNCGSKVVPVNGRCPVCGANM